MTDNVRIMDTLVSIGCDVQAKNKAAFFSLKYIETDSHKCTVVGSGNLDVSKSE